MTDIVGSFHGIARTPASMARFAAHLAGQGYLIRNQVIHRPGSAFPTLPTSFCPHSRGLVCGSRREGPPDRGWAGDPRDPQALPAHEPWTGGDGRHSQWRQPNRRLCGTGPCSESFYGPAGQQLVTNQRALAELFGAVDYELGIIAGNRTIDPVSSFIIGSKCAKRWKSERWQHRASGRGAHRDRSKPHIFPLEPGDVASSVGFLASGHFTDHSSFAFLPH